PELVELFVAAGFKKVFIGLETPNETSLVECGKRQNTRRDLVASVQILQRAGLEVMGGFIVGFDHDEHSIFERQLRFIQEAGVVTAMVGLLAALPRTRLFERLKAEGRLLRESTGNNLDAVLNFVPRMEATKLIAGYRDLLQRLYAPRGYYRRALTFLGSYRPRGPRAPFSRAEFWAFLRSLWVLGVRTRGRRAYWRYFLHVLVRYRQGFGEAMNMAITGYHFRRIAAHV
ncbi:MAG: DUF4070 domain-containing protein, partial [Planctomycetota bacterium]